MTLRSTTAAQVQSGRPPELKAAIRPWYDATEARILSVVQLLPARLGRSTLPPHSIREVVFGFEDGVVQNMTLIAGMVGASLSSAVVILAGSVNAIAGVVSMSMGTYLSSQAERDALVNAGAPPAHGLRSPARDAMVMAGAYAVGAIVPLLAFAVPGLDRGAAIVLAIGLTVLTLFGLGVVKAMACGQDRLRSGLQLLALATAAGLTGYLVGAVARAVFHIDI